MKKIFLSIAIMAFAAAAAAQQYKWVDKDGKVRYGDVPPPGVKATPLRPPPPAASAPAAPAGKKDEKKLTPEQAFQKRQKEQAEQEAKSSKERADADAKRANCEQAQASLRALESGQRVSRTNAAGEQVFLEDAEREREKARAQKLVGEWCK